MSTTAFEIEEQGAETAKAQQSAAGSASAPPEVVVTQIMIGSLAAQVLYVTAKLGIADLLADGPKSVEDLATATDTHAPSLYRILRAAESVGVFVEKENRVFALNANAEPLRSNVPNSLRDIAIFMGEDWHWEVWGKTMYSVRTGKSAWAHAHGDDDVFDYFRKRPEAFEVFNRAMTSLTALSAKAVSEGYDFTGVKTLIDIAGGHGRLLTEILEVNPSMRGILFDMPQVIEGARESVAKTNAADRVEFEGGDFFVSVPAGGDAYMMKHIIHDWDDEKSLMILRNIKQAMNPGGRVLLVESVIAERGAQDFGKLMDIEMLVSPGGKERTAAEYEDLFARAGLRMTRIVPTKSAYSVIEAVAAE
ncbi:MAG TPA: methyltransferase [Pyrinomonadaceae bacterium]|nr:methyltransferase [Pyrinomonadaceae bacterium]